MRKYQVFFENYYQSSDSLKGSKDEHFFDLLKLLYIKLYHN